MTQSLWCPAEIGTTWQISRTLTKKKKIKKKIKEKEIMFYQLSGHPSVHLTHKIHHHRCACSHYLLGL